MQWQLHAPAQLLLCPRPGLQCSITIITESSGRLLLLLQLNLMQARKKLDRDWMDGETECHPTWQLVVNGRRAYNLVDGLIKIFPPPPPSSSSLCGLRNLCPFLNAKIFKYDFLSPSRNLSPSPSLSFHIAPHALFK